jgi:hypothetical protein
MTGLYNSIEIVKKEDKTKGDGLNPHLNDESKQL